MMKQIIAGCSLMVLLICSGFAQAEGVSLRYAPGAPLQIALLDSLDIPVDIRDKVRLKGDLQMIAREEVAGLKQWQRKKIPKVAVYSNMILPGLGQVYNGRRLKTVLMVGLTSFYMGKSWLHFKRSVTREKLRDRYLSGTVDFRLQDAWYEFHKESAKDYLWWSGAVWIIGMLDAYIDAHLFELRSYVPESENKQASYLSLSMSF